MNFNERVEQAGNDAVRLLLNTPENIPLSVCDFKFAIQSFASALKEPARIVTNICDECQRPFYRDPTPEEMKKYKEPAEFSWEDTDREIKSLDGLAADQGIGTPDEQLAAVERDAGTLPDLPDFTDAPLVRNPDGEIWVHGIRFRGWIHIPENRTKGYEFVTLAEAFRVGALVRWECKTLKHVIEGPITEYNVEDADWPYVTFSFTGDSEDERYLAEACTLVEPAKEVDDGK